MNPAMAGDGGRKESEGGRQPLSRLRANEIRYAVEAASGGKVDKEEFSAARKEVRRAQEELVRWFELDQ